MAGRRSARDVLRRICGFAEPHPEERRLRRVSKDGATYGPHGSRRRFAAPHHEEHYTVGRVFQKPTTRSAVAGISRAKFTRALSISADDAVRFGPSRSRIRARTVAHSRPI